MDQVIRPWTEADREVTLEAIGFANRRIVSAWIEREPPREIPWTPLAKPLRECRVALVSTAGLALHGDTPFDQEGERRNPWWGDPSYRVLPRDTRTGDVRSYHLHIDASRRRARPRVPDAPGPARRARVRGRRGRERPVALLLHGLHPEAEGAPGALRPPP